MSDAKPAAEKAAPKKGGKKKLIIIVAIAVLVLGGAGGGAAWFFLRPKADPAAGAQAAAPGGAATMAAPGAQPGLPGQPAMPAHPGAAGAAAPGTVTLPGAPIQNPGRKGAPQFLPVDTFTVNIQGDGSEHYLQVGITLQTVDGPTNEKVKEYLPGIRNSLLLLLTSKQVDELKTLAGKEKLASEILAAARMHLPGTTPDRGLETVLFTSFMIQ